MSYDMALLLANVSRRLLERPCISLKELSRSLQVSRRTIEKAVKVTTGKSFRSFRQQSMLATIKELIASEPCRTVKELSFAVGYKSPRSFARAIRTLCGVSPEQLRSELGRDMNVGRARARGAGRGASSREFLE